MPPLLRHGCPVCPLLPPFTRLSVRLSVRLRASAEPSPAPSPRVPEPPPDFDFRAATTGATRALIAVRHPELLDLVEEGVLVAVERARPYVERRTDGYREPAVVYLVGTAHTCGRAAEDVRRTVRALRPENVVVELCRSRAGAMYDEPAMGRGEEEGKKGGSKASNLMAISGENFASAMGRSLKLGGRSALAFRLLLSGLSQRVEDAAGGVRVGEEFRAARRAAEEVGSQLVLGDRPIEITLQRAWKALTWQEKVKLLKVLWLSSTSVPLDVTQKAMDELKSDDALSAIFAKLSGEFPSLICPLVHERDVYLAWSLKRSKAVNGCSTVVGVIGRGHLRGVVYALLHNQENLKFKDLVGSRDRENGRKAAIGKFAKNLVIETAIGTVLWIIYTQLFASNGI